MKYRITKKVTLDLSIDASEAIMFMKGGKHTAQLSASKLTFKDSEDELIDVEINVQLERKDHQKFDWITREAIKARDLAKEEEPQ
jgi:hypothetical protein